MIDILRISREILLKWMTEAFVESTSTPVQAMFRWRQEATGINVSIFTEIYDAV